MTRWMVVPAVVAFAATACTAGEDPIEQETTAAAGDAQEFADMRAAVAEVDSVQYTLTQDDGQRSQTVALAVGGLSSEDDSDLRVQIVVDEGERRQETIVVDGTQYTQIDTGEEDNPLAGRWLEVPVSDEELAQLRDATPATFVDDLSAAVIGFEPDGAVEQIDGVEAQPYAVTLDPDRLDLFLAPEAGDSGQAPTGTFWVSDADLPVRFVGQDAGGEYEFNFGAWDEPVDVGAPPDEEVVTEAELRDLAD